MRKRRIMGGAGREGRRLVIAVAMMVLAVLGVASSAVAQPTGAFAVFAQCPLGTVQMNGCVYAPVESGEIAIGKTSVPIANTMVLQGGLLEETEPFVKVLAGAVNGETLTAVPQPVPGGLFGAVKCNQIGSFPLRKACRNALGSRLNDVSAVTELAGPASSIVFNAAFEQLQFATALTLPIKVHLENPLLGHECYIGSDTDPIMLDLTTGPTVGGPTGAPGTQKGKEKGKILEISGTSLVSNTFAVPVATGCGPFGLSDSLIDSEIGLPSPAGANTVILNGKVEIANSEFVEESEESTSTTPPGPPHEHPGRPREKWSHTPGEEWEHPSGGTHWHP